MEQIEILMPLLEEGTTVFRPVPSVKISDRVYKVLGEDVYDPAVEVWAFKPGQIVEVEEREFEGEILMVATRALD